MTTVRICVSLKKETLDLLDKSKGIATRSAIIDLMITKSLDRQIIKNNEKDESAEASFLTNNLLERLSDVKLL